MCDVINPQVLIRNQHNPQNIDVEARFFSFQVISTTYVYVSVFCVLSMYDQTGEVLKKVH